LGPSVHKISWNCEVRYNCQFVQGDQSCFHQAAAVLLFICSSVWLAHPPARWGNSVLNAALCSRDQLQDPPLALLWEFGLLPHLHCLPLCFFQSLLGTSGSFGSLACHPSTAVSLYGSLGLCLVLMAPLGVWLVVLLLLSAFAALPVLDH
jgi:hypothetical protein